VRGPGKPGNPSVGAVRGAKTRGDPELHRWRSRKMQGFGATRGPHRRRRGRREDSGRPGDPQPKALQGCEIRGNSRIHRWHSRRTCAQGDLEARRRGCRRTRTRGNPGMRTRQGRKMREPGQPGASSSSWGMIDDPVSCKGTQKTPETPVSGVFNLGGPFRGAGAPAPQSPAVAVSRCGEAGLPGSVSGSRRLLTALRRACSC